MDVSGMVTVSKAEQPVKALVPMDVTELGMSIEARLRHPRKAEPPMVSTESPMLTDAN